MYNILNDYIVDAFFFAVLIAEDGGKGEIQCWRGFWEFWLSLGEVINQLHIYFISL
jgi:hypothetical protein